MTCSPGDDRRLDGDWGWDLAVLLIFIALIGVGLWAYHGGYGDRAVAVTAAADTTGQRLPPPRRAAQPPPGTLILLH